MAISAGYFTSLKWVMRRARAGIATDADVRRLAALCARYYPKDKQRAEWYKVIKRG